MTTSPDGRTMTYTCNTGYSLAGPNSRLCTTNGTGWSGTFTCNLNYTVAGDQRLTCQPDGKWSGSQPVCVMDMLRFITTDGRLTSAAFSCNQGYQLTGSGTLQCTSDGLWDLSPPACGKNETSSACEIDERNPPAEPAHGSMSITGGLSAAYRCNVGYTLLGPAIRTCRADGTGWSGNEPMRCPSMSTSSGLSYVVSATAGGQSVASFRCADGYSIEGALQVTCLRNGTWDTKQPTCGNTL
ncbi:hypothetical protein DPMN_114338 [Dreissena polymorpha]|uniref:Sushi domain-containing protein n=1 Tax=Dreissena polymorpha TaxID=45954 RepID=A0A9D4KJU0_DREPO|nr:hypothetical protein DPMN_114338 [Dreissena polymorpha]